MYLTILLVVLITTRLLSQSANLKFDNIGLEQGLSQSTVYSITQDAQGFIWFGTQDGLNRYDGYSLTIFKHKPNDSNSISDNTIRCLLSDSRGDLWIGTERGGLNRYVLSENKFYHYKHKETDNTTISGNYIISLFEDSNGDIWIGTYNKGLNRFNRNTQSFTRFLFDEVDSTTLSSNIVWAIQEDKKKNLWIATSMGLSKYKLEQKTSISNKNSFQRFYNNSKNQKSLSSNNIRALHIDRDGIFWIGTWGGGLYTFDEKTKQFKRYKHNVMGNNLFSARYIMTILEDSRENFWLGTQDSGLLTYERQNYVIRQYIKDDILSLFEDKSGILWIGTLSYGVFSYDKHKNKFFHYKNDLSYSKDLLTNIVTSIIKDKSGDLWVGTYGGGLHRYNNKLEKLKTFRSNSNDINSISDDKIFALCESKDGNIWIGTKSGFNRFDKTTGRFKRYKHVPSDSNSIGFNQISALFCDREGNIWVGSSTGGIDRFNPRTNIFTHYPVNKKIPNTIPAGAIMVIYEGKRSGLWVGTFGGGVSKYIPETNNFKIFQIESEPNISINNNTVITVYEDEAGFVWMGTYGGGLNRYDPIHNNFKYYTLQHGLPNDVIYGILPDTTGNLWLSTNKGISRFNPKTKTFRNYDVKDGLQSNEFNQGAYFASQDGKLFFGGVNGFNAFSPDDIKDNEYIPSVYITTFKVFDEVLPLPNPIPKNTKLELSYSQNFFSFEFVALNYTASEKNQYAYLLEGFDKDWHYVPAKQRFASYTNLDPGEYILRVKGSNNDGIWNEEGTSITIIINPPFWMTLWFRIVIGVVIFIVLGGTLNYFLTKKIKEKTKKFEQEAAMAQEKMRIASDLHDNLGSRLTEIRLLSEMALKESNEKTVNAFREISEAAQNIISEFSEIVWSVNPNNDSFENLAEYIGQFAVDYLSKVNIRCRLDLLQEIPFEKASSEVRHNIFLAVKEALNNAVKYSETEEIQIKVEIIDKLFKLIVRDFGKGFDIKDPKRFGNGLLNMKRRMERIGGSCEVDTIIGVGTTIIFSIPLNIRN